MKRREKLVIFIIFIIVSEVSRATLIKQRIKVYKNELIFELEPRAIRNRMELSKSKHIPKDGIDADNDGRSCRENVESLLALVENGSSDVIEEFVTVLKDSGYDQIVAMIDPPDIHSKAGK